MQHRQDDFRTSAPGLQPFGPIKMTSGKLTAAEIAEARSGPAGVRALCMRLKAEGRV